MGGLPEAQLVYEVDTYHITSKRSGTNDVLDNFLDMREQTEFRNQQKMIDIAVVQLVCVVI